jgi:hypothetical protein
MAVDPRRTDHLMALRQELLTQMEEADRELGHVRMQVERMESDLRIGLAEAAGYQDAKGHALPRAEKRVVDLYRELLKLEDKLNADRAATGA